MHTDAMKDQKPKTIRVTVPVTPEVQEVFKRLSEATGVSVGKAMGDWLADTAEAAISMADLLEKARQQPRLVAREMHSYALGITDLTSGILESMRRPQTGVTPPVSNTGGKLPQKPKTVGGRNSKKQGGRSAKG